MASDSLQLAWLESFLSVSEHGGFTRAARATHRTQPRISAHIAALERALGEDLLVRTARGATLTLAGELLLPRVRAMMRELRTGTDAVHGLRQQMQGHVRIGSYPGASAVIVAPVMQNFRRRYPAVRLSLLESGPHGVEMAISRDDIDLAVRASDMPQAHHDMTSARLCHEKIVLVVREDHPLATEATVDLGRLVHETLIVSGEPHNLWTDYQDRLGQVGVEPEDLISAAIPTTVVALVRAGMGVGLLGSFAAHVSVNGGDLTTRELPTPLWQREIRLHHRREESPPAVTAFRDSLVTEAPGLTQSLAVW